MSTAVAEIPRRNWSEYWREAAGLGIFMVSASCFGVLLEYPGSALHLATPDPFWRRVIMGCAMGLTAVGLIYSPWGRRSGAHYNPAVTLTFYRLGKVALIDLLGYVIAQFVGGVTGMLLARAALGEWLSDRSVHFVATLPGMRGVGWAFAAEFAITAVLMTVVLTVSQSTRFSRFTGWCAGACVALFITFEAPWSGMSLNPARSFASAVVAQEWTALWIYFTAPPLGMLAAAEMHRRFAPHRKACAKLHHTPRDRCIFCEHQARVALRTR